MYRDWIKIFLLSGKINVLILLYRIVICPPWYDGNIFGKQLCTEPLPVTNGVKQGYVIAPMLFSILFAVDVAIGSFQDKSRAGITINYRSDGRVFDLLQVFLFTGECALTATSKNSLQVLAHNL